MIHSLMDKWWAPILALMVLMVCLDTLLISCGDDGGGPVRAPAKIDNASYGQSTWQVTTDPNTGRVFDCLVLPGYHEFGTWCYEVSK